MVNKTLLPRHIAIIMDGNGRWAQQQGVSVEEGHRRGVVALKNTIRCCGELGIEVLTVFAFSSENWKRSRQEVDSLMRLFDETIVSSLPELIEHKVSLRVIGERSQLDPELVELITSAEKETQGGDYTLVIALNYGGKQDIVYAVRKLASKVKAGTIALADIDDALFTTELALADLPPPDLCIRTSNEHRLSNFMLWQLAYCELYFCEVLWPDFSNDDLKDALADYANRQRRYGGRVAAENTNSQIAALNNTAANQSDKS